MEASKSSPGQGWSVGRLILIIALAIAGISIAYAMTRGTGPAESVQNPPIRTPQGDPDAQLAGLQNRVGADPKDAEGWQQLGFAYFNAGRFADAGRAYKRAAELVPGNATFWSSLGEALVMASEKDPMPAEAAAAFDKAVAIDPKEPRARYFLAVRKDLSGDHEGAIADWLALLSDTPAGAPWEADLRRTITQVGKINKIAVDERLAAIKPSAAPHPDVVAPSVATAAIPGPTRQQMQSAAQMPKGQQDQMIAGMVASLEGKLAANPGNIDGWIMLMRSRMTLGETGKASSALQKAVAANPAQANRLKAEAKSIGVPGA